MTVEKVSVTLDKDLLAEARARINGDTSLSAYLNEALRRKLANERLGDYFRELDAESGPLTEEEKREGEEWLEEVRSRIEPGYRVRA